MLCFCTSERLFSYFVLSLRENITAILKTRGRLNA